MPLPLLPSGPGGIHGGSSRRRRCGLPWRWGEGGIRTHETVAGLLEFQSSAFDRSAISPRATRARSVPKACSPRNSGRWLRSLSRGLRSLARWLRRLRPIALWEIAAGPLRKIGGRIVEAALGICAGSVRSAELRNFEPAARIRRVEAGRDFQGWNAVGIPVLRRRVAGE